MWGGGEQQRPSEVPQNRLIPFKQVRMVASGTTTKQDSIMSFLLSHPPESSSSRPRKASFHSCPPTPALQSSYPPDPPKAADYCFHGSALHLRVCVGDVNNVNLLIQGASGGTQRDCVTETSAYLWMSCLEHEVLKKTRPLVDNHILLLLQTCHFALMPLSTLFFL